MRFCLILCFSIFFGAASILATANMSFAATYKPKGFKPAPTGVIAKVSNNPGKSLGAAGCGVAIAFFPPAAVVCGALILTGTAADEVIK